MASEKELCSLGARTLPVTWTVLLAILALCVAGSAADYVHNHHHLLAREEEGLPRGGLLEVEQQQGGGTHTAGPFSCANTPNPLAQAILSGSEKAYAFGGIPENCGEGYGCKSDYWGRWCRFRHGSAPQCPAELQEDLQGRLRQAAKEGHMWARDILLVRPCEIFPSLEGRTLWIIGDSMSKDFAFAFQCFMLEYWDREDTGRWPKNASLSPNVSEDAGLMKEVFQALSKVEPNQESNPWYLQWCVPMYSGTRMCFLRANTGAFVAESLMPLLPRLATKDDIVLLNFGLHSKDNGTLYGYINELEQFGQQYMQLKDQLPQFLWRQTSVQHFTTNTGEWVPDKPMHEQRCVPMQGVELKNDGSLGSDGGSALEGQVATDMTDATDTIMRGGRRNVRSAVIMGKLGIPVVHIWNQTVPFWDFHRFYHDPEDGTTCAKVPCDCTHICVPSWHQMWMASLQHSLTKLGKKGSPRHEEWGTPPDFPVPGINVPLKYIPAEHTVWEQFGAESIQAWSSSIATERDADDSEIGQINR